MRVSEFTRGAPRSLSIIGQKVFSETKLMCWILMPATFLRYGRIQKKKRLTILEQLSWDMWKKIPTRKHFVQMFFNKRILLFYVNSALFQLYCKQMVLIQNIICKYAGCFFDTKYACEMSGIWVSFFLKTNPSSNFTKDFFISWNYHV